ncbi:MAG: hypothetical protein V1888_00390 [archaeon]
MTINLEKWATEANRVIQLYESFEFFLGSRSWEKDTYKLMNDLVKNETIIQGSNYQALFGNLRYAYEQITGERVFPEVLA